MPLRSYVQPLIIMSAIPFGLIGAVWAHVSMMSMFGLVALTGVVVNDSLIMVDFINRARATHTDVGRMAQQAGSGPADRRLFETAGLALAVREAGVHLPADPAHVAHHLLRGEPPVVEHEDLVQTALNFTAGGRVQVIPGDAGFAPHDDLTLVHQSRRTSVRTCGSMR